jgi:hypothetical protein
VWIGCNSVMTAWMPPTVNAPPPSTRWPDGQFALAGFDACLSIADWPGATCTEPGGMVVADAGATPSAPVAMTVRPRVTAGAHFFVERPFTAPADAPVTNVLRILLRGFTISFSSWSGPNGLVDLAWGVRRRCVASGGGGQRLVDQRQFVSGINPGTEWADGASVSIRVASLSSSTPDP